MFEVGDKKDVLIVTHVSPDGDAIGSVSAMAWIVKEAGMNPIPFVEEIPESYAPFAHPDIIVDKDVDLSKLDAIVCVDCANVARLFTPFGDWENRPDVSVINYDHHGTNEMYGEINYVEVDKAATCEIIALNFGPEFISPEAATALYLGLVTDTGGFKFSNVKPDTYETASMLMSYGADHNAVIESVFFSKSPGQVAFEASMMAKAEYRYDGKMIFGLIRSSDFSKYGVEPSAVEESTAKLREVRGVKVAIRLIEAGEGIRISLRSKDLEIDVSEVAKRFNGGGHKMAAGAFIESCSLEGAMEQITGAFKEILG